MMHNNLSFKTFDPEQTRRDHFDHNIWALPDWFQFGALSYFWTRVYEIKPDLQHFTFFQVLWDHSPSFVYAEQTREYL